VEGGKRGTRFDQKCSLDDLLDAAGNAQTMKLARAESLENQQIERALEEVCRLCARELGSYRMTI
jgi:hypothetical protein